MSDGEMLLVALGIGSVFVVQMAMWLDIRRIRATLPPVPESKRPT